MTTIDYTSFQDTDLVLPNGKDIDQEINFSTKGVDTTKSAVLSFRALPAPSSGAVTLTVGIKPQGQTGNGTTVYTQAFGANVERVVQENFNQTLLQDNNTLVVRVSGSGSVTVSDFHVLYKKI